MQTLDLQGRRTITGVETGFHDLDDRTRGLQPGELVILAGPPGVGKSAMALSIAEHVSVDTNQAVAFFSLEMSRVELALRLLSSRAKVDGQKLRKGTLSNAEVQKILDVAGFLCQAPLHIYETPALSLEDFALRVRKCIDADKCHLVVLDYVNLMEPMSPLALYEKTSRIAATLKALASRIHVPILALAQLRRPDEDHRRPRMADLRDSGFMEEAADVVLLLHREEMRHTPGTQEYDQAHGSAELIIAKQRNGPTDTVNLTWQREYTRFQTWSPREAPPGADFAQYDAQRAPAAEPEEAAPF